MPSVDALNAVSPPLASAHPRCRADRRRSGADPGHQLLRARPAHPGPAGAGGADWSLGWMCTGCSRLGRSRPVRGRCKTKLTLGQLEQGARCVCLGCWTTIQSARQVSSYRRADWPCARGRCPDLGGVPGPSCALLTLGLLEQVCSGITWSRLSVGHAVGVHRVWSPGPGAGSRHGRCKTKLWAGR